MCGIVGIHQFSSNWPQLDIAAIRPLCDVLAHRGPDGEGIWIAPDGATALGHRRLAIIDLSEGAAQPMSDGTGSVWITFNGEIYNHRELRRELEGLGCQFHTAGSDSEVIIHAYRQWGIDSVHRLRGMFAFGLWDVESRRLWLVRDRLGIKPLYYTQQSGRVIFASEIKALLAVPSVERMIDEESFFHYLGFLATPAPRTMFSGINKLDAGTMLVFENNRGPRIIRYWDPLSDCRVANGSVETIANEVRERFVESVRLHSVSDVPVGIFLSGGIDSSAIAAVQSQTEPGTLHAFCAGYDQNYRTTPDETAKARDFAKRIGIDFHEVELSLDMATDFLPRMAGILDEPLADPVCVPLYHVAQLARDNGIKACMVGEGADELFIGYPGWRRAQALQRLNNRFPFPAWTKGIGLQALQTMGKHETQPYDWLDRARQSLPIFWGGAEAFSGVSRNAVLSTRMREAFKGRSSWEALAPIHARYSEKAKHPSILQWMTYLDLNFRLPELLLMRVDKMTMACGLEARVPFLDHELVSYALGIPDALKLRGGDLKHILKTAVRGLIPDSIIARPKQGFGTPIQEWFVSGLSRRFKTEIDDFVRQTDLFDADRVQTLLDHPHHAMSKWMILMLSLWWKAHFRVV